MSTFLDLLQESNPSFARLTKPNQEKLRRLETVFAETSACSLADLFAILAPRLQPKSFKTSLQRLKELVADFTTNRWQLAYAPETDLVTLGLAPTLGPAEQLAASSLTLDTRQSVRPRAKAPPARTVFLSLAHEQEPLQEAHLARIISLVCARTMLLSRQHPSLSDVTLFADGQIAAHDRCITARVSDELQNTDVVVAFLWPRYMDRATDKDTGLNVIRDEELPFIQSHPDRSILVAYGSLTGLDGLRRHLFGDKPVALYNSPVRHARDEEAIDKWVNAVAAAIIAALLARPPLLPVRATPGRPGKNAVIGRPNGSASLPKVPNNNQHNRGLDQEAERLAQKFEDARVPPLAKAGDFSRAEGATGMDLLEALKDWVHDPKAAPFCAVLGETGQGKTTAMQMFARRLLDERARAAKRNPDKPLTGCLPIYVDLRKYQYSPDDKVEDLLKKVLVFAGKVGDEVEAGFAELIKALHRGELCVIFDGLDERTVGMTREEAQRFIAQLWRIFPQEQLAAWRSYYQLRANLKDSGKEPKPPAPMGKMLLTCRTHYFRTLSELYATLLDGTRGDTQREDFKLYHLLPFSEEQIRQYLKARLPLRDPDRVMALFCRVHKLRELVERPLLLRMITDRIDVIERISATTGKPVLTVDIYKDIVSDWLMRDNPKHKISAPYKPQLMESLACELWQKRSRSMSAEKLDEWLDQFLFDRPHIRAAHDKVTQELLKEDLRTATFIVHGVGAHGTESQYSFAHTSFLEYFLAQALWRQMLKGKLDNTLFKSVAPSIETAQFLAELRVNADEDDGSTFDETLAALLAQVRTVRNVWLFGVFLRLVKFGCAPALPALNLEGADLSGWTIEGPQHCALRLPCAQFRNATLSHSKWTNVDLTGADLRGVNADSAMLDEVNLNGAKTDGTTMMKYLSWRHSAMKRPAWMLAEAEFAITTDQLLKAEPTFNRMHEGHTEVVGCVSLSADGQWVASGSWDKTVKIWDRATGGCVQTLKGHAEAVQRVSLSADGHWVASGSWDKTVKIWDRATGRCVQTLEGHTRAVIGVSLSADGQWVASGSEEGTVKIWDRAMGVCVQTLEGHAGAVYAVSLSADGQWVASGSDDETVKIWDRATGECVQTLEGHTARVRCLSLSADGQWVASGSDDKTVKIWDRATGACVQTLGGHTREVYGVSLSADSQWVASGSQDDTVKVWDRASGACVQTLKGHTAAVKGVSLSADGQWVASSSIDQTVRIWDRATGKCIQTLEGNYQAVKGVSLSADGDWVASGSKDNTVKIWDRATGECVQTLEGDNHGVMDVSLSADGQWVAFGSRYGTVKIWDRPTGECVQMLEGQTGAAFGVSLTADGHWVASGGGQGTVKVWDRASGACVQTLKGHTAAVKGVSLSADGQWVASGSWDETVKIWDRTTGECVQTLKGHTARVRCVSLSADGHWVASGAGDGTVKIWDRATYACVHTLEGHTDAVCGVSLSADGQWVASGSDDQTVKIWERATGACVHTLEGHTDAVLGVSLSANGQWVASGSRDGTVKIWDRTTGACVQTLCSLPSSEWVSIDSVTRRFKVASTGAWPYLGYDLPDGTRLDRGIFGPIPEVV